MKHFTPERYLRLGNLDNRTTFLAAQEEWERALTAYQRQLGRIKQRLPVGLRNLLASTSLHDARVLAIWHGRRNRFTVTLHPESDPAKLVVLAYALVEPPQIIPDVLPEEARSAPVAWLYDEVNIPAAAHNGKGGTTLSHDLLLSNGWEVRLRFRAVTVTRPAPILPAAAGESTARPSVSRSA